MRHFCTCQSFHSGGDTIVSPDFAEFYGGLLRDLWETFFILGDLKQKRCILLLPLFMLALTAWGQSQQKALQAFNSLYQKAAAYDSLSLYGPCITALTAAIDQASRHHLDTEQVEATITLAEVLRKTHD